MVNLPINNKLSVKILIVVAAECKPTHRGTRRNFPIFKLYPDNTISPSKMSSILIYPDCNVYIQLIQYFMIASYFIYKIVLLACILYVHNFYHLHTYPILFYITKHQNIIKVMQMLNL